MVRERQLEPPLTDPDHMRRFCSATGEPDFRISPPGSIVQMIARILLMLVLQPVASHAHLVKKSEIDRSELPKPLGKHSLEV